MKIEKTARARHPYRICGALFHQFNSDISLCDLFYYISDISLVIFSNRFDDGELSETTSLPLFSSPLVFRSLSETKQNNLIGFKGESFKCLGSHPFVSRFRSIIC